MLNDPEKVSLGEGGSNLGFDETNSVDKRLKGKIVGMNLYIVILMHLVLNQIQIMS